MAEIKIKFNQPNFLLKVRSIFDKDLRRFANEDFYKQMEDYVPAKSTLMYRQAEVTDKGIRFYSKYARFQYYGKLMISPTTGSPWALKGEKKLLTDVNLKYNREVHPLATSKWDEVAWKAKKDIVAKDIKEYIKRRKHNGR